MQANVKRIGTKEVNSNDYVSLEKTPILEEVRAEKRKDRAFELHLAARCLLDLTSGNFSN